MSFVFFVKSGINSCWHFYVSEHEVAMLFLTLLASFTLPPDEKPAIDRQQLIRILDASWNPINDIEFVYEGNIALRDRSIRPDALRPGKVINPDDFAFHYQGTFAWRADASIHIENYVQNVDPRQPLSIQVTTLFRDQMIKHNRIPDENPGRAPDSPTPGGVDSFDSSMSPIRFFQHPLLGPYLKAYDWHYKFLRWETDGESRVLVIELANRPEPYPKGTVRSRYWIDMDRGALPVKIERYVEENLRLRLSNINLVNMTAVDGKRVWIPVSGTLHSFLDGLSSYSKTPVFEETYAVVNGTIRVNQGLPDSRFRVDYQVKPTTEGLVKAKMTFDAGVEALRGKQVSPGERIDAMLAEADRQSAQLVASAPSRDSWLARNGLFAIPLGLGLAALTWGGVKAWKGRRWAS